MRCLHVRLNFILVLVTNLLFQLVRFHFILDLFTNMLFSCVRTQYIFISILYTSLAAIITFNTHSLWLRYNYFIIFHWYQIFCSLLPEKSFPEDKECFISLIMITRKWILGFLRILVQGRVTKYIVIERIGFSHW